MGDIVEQPLESNGSHLVEPPIVDTLIRDKARSQWVVSFVPEDSVSQREKEQVVIPFNSADGRRILLRVIRLEGLLGDEIVRVFHAGDGNFNFFAPSGDPITLADPHGSMDLSLRAYVELTDIAMTAQIAFRTPAGASTS